MNKVKKIGVAVVNVISMIMILLAVGVLLITVFTKSGEVPNVFGYSAFRVMTGSMAPTISTDSLIVVKISDKSELSVGDIISFYSSDPAIEGEVNTHRITEIGEDIKGWYCTTKGDANNIEDKYETREKNLIGKVVFSSLFLGNAVRLLSNPLVFIPFILGPLVIMIVVNAIHSIRLAARLSKEEEEKAVREALNELKQDKNPKD